jgi:hypothetical protein
MDLWYVIEVVRLLREWTEWLKKSKSSICLIGSMGRRSGVTCRECSLNTSLVLSPLAKLSRVQIVIVGFKRVATFERFDEFPSR